MTEWYWVFDSDGIDMKVNEQERDELLARGLIQSGSNSRHFSTDADWSEIDAVCYELAGMKAA